MQDMLYLVAIIGIFTSVILYYSARIKNEGLKERKEILEDIKHISTLVETIKQQNTQEKDRMQVMELIDSWSMEVARIIDSRPAHIENLPQTLKILKQKLKYSIEKVDQDLGAYWTILKSGKYIDHANSARECKENIARYVVNHMLTGNEQIFLDSGTTTTQVAHKLAEYKKEQVQIYTNNLFAAIYLMSQKHPCGLLGGRLDYRSRILYSALLGEQTRLAFENTNANVIVLGVTSISFEEGPNTTGGESKQFRKLLMETAKNEEIKLIIVADYTKFLKKEIGDEPVLSSKEWESYRDTIDFKLVTAGGPEGADQAKFQEQVSKFGSKITVVDAPNWLITD